MGLVKLFINNVVKPLHEVELTKEGERAIDQIRLKTPKSVDPTVNQELKYLQDMADLSSLVSIYNFQGNVEDESGNNLNGTASNITYGTDSWGGKSATFNGSNGNVTVANNSKFDFETQFDVFIWAKWTATTTGMHLFSKRVEGDVFQDDVYQDDVFITSGDLGISIQVNAATAGDVRCQVNNTVITSSSAGFNDGNWHLIRLTRDRSNVITLYVDNTAKGNATMSGSATTSTTLYIGSDFPPANYFNGSISRLRVYSTSLETNQAKNIYLKRNPRSTLKFGGRITKIDSELSNRSIIAQSFGKILAETEINGQVYSNRTPEYIVEDLITQKSDLTYSTSSGASGITLTQYVADGKLIDVLKDLSALTNRIFYTTGSKLLVFDNVSFNNLDLTLEHGSDVRVGDDGYDDTEIVNDLTVLGQNLRYSTIETFNGNNNTVAFTVDNNPVTVKVTVGGAEKSPEVDYIFDTMTRTITFTTAPASGTNNISVSYTFEKPLYIRGTKESSITIYGRHAKKLNLPWITTREDGVRFVQSYLNRYKDISRKVKVTSGKLFNSLQENDIIHVKNTIKSLASDFVIKSIKWSYPKMETEIEVGEYYFDFFEYDKEIVAKIHDLESTITRVKDVREYESPEEILAFADSIVMKLQNFKLTESLSMTATPNIYDKENNTYSSGSVSSTFQTNIFQSNVFRTAGFVNPPTSATYGSRVSGSVYVSE